MIDVSRTGLPAGETGFSLSGFGFEAYNSKDERLTPVLLDLSSGVL